MQENPENEPQEGFLRVRKVRKRPKQLSGINTPVKLNLTAKLNSRLNTAEERMIKLESNPKKLLRKQTQERG